MVAYRTSLGFSCGSAGKESTCNGGDLGLIPRLGRPPGEGEGYPLQFSGLENSMACIFHEFAKSWTWLSHSHFHFQAFPDSSVGKESVWMQETLVQSLGWKDPLEKGKATHSSILAWRIPWTITKSLTWLRDFHFHFWQPIVGCVWIYRFSKRTYRKVRKQDNTVGRENA